MSDEIACQAFVNPFTAYGMLETSGLQAGDHLLITAGASAWGKLVVQMAAKKGIHVACTVRREEQKAVLKSLGADVVVNVQEENLGKVLKSWAPEGVKAVFDAVGGDQGAKAMNCLTNGGTMYVFGLLSLQPIPLHSGVMIFKNLKIEGWWLSSWWEKLGSDGIQKAMKAVFGYLLSQEVTVDIQAKYPLKQFKEAIEAYEKEGRTGKILIC
jgi:NADPH:quinone reductase-like Zn-dependent oxidoreductase